MKNFRDDPKNGDAADVATTAAKTDAPLAKTEGKSDDKPAIVESADQPSVAAPSSALANQVFEGDAKTSVVTLAAKPAKAPDKSTPSAPATPGPAAPSSTPPASSTPVSTAPAPAAGTSSAKASVASPRVRRGFYVTGFAVHPVPVIWAIVIAYLLQPFDGMLVDDLPFTPPGIRTNVWGSDIYTSLAEILLAVAALFIIRRNLRSPFGFRRPVGASYLGYAVAAGVLLGAALAAHYALNLAAHTVPSDAIRPTQVNVFGMLVGRGLFSSSADEIVFRGVLLTYLAARIPGRIGIGRFEMDIAGVFVALLYCLCYSLDLVRYPFMIAGPELLMVFLFGVFAAYWVEKSKSLIAPIVGHGIGNAIQTAALLVISGMA